MGFYFMQKIIEYILTFLSVAMVNQNQSINNKRVAKYDNLKGLAIILVVFVHVISPVRYNIDFYFTLTNLIVIFAMPIFFFVGGHFSKISEGSSFKAFKNILIPYVVFSVIWIIFNYFILGRSLPGLPFLVPVYGLWFLLSLFTMKLILPILVKIKYILPITIILSLLIGLVPISDDFLSYSRTFCFLPVFLVGYYYNDYKKVFYDRIAKKHESIFNLLKSKAFVFIILILFLILMWNFCLYSLSYVSYAQSFDLMQLKSSYVDIELSRSEGIISRLIVIISGIMAALFASKLITNKVTFLTKLGINSLTVYILHVYITRFIFLELRRDSPLEFIFNDPLLSGIYAIFMVSLISYILSGDFVNKIFNGLINVSVNVIMYPFYQIFNKNETVNKEDTDK